MKQQIVYFKPSKRPIKEKYICIGPRSTAGIKEWPYENWKELATKLSKKGYKIVNLSYEGFEGKDIINKKELMDNSLTLEGVLTTEKA